MMLLKSNFDVLFQFRKDKTMRVTVGINLGNARLGTFNATSLVPHHLLTHSAFRQYWPLPSSSLASKTPMRRPPRPSPGRRLARPHLQYPTGRSRPASLVSNHHPGPRSLLVAPHSPTPTIFPIPCSRPPCHMSE